jgi:hypothetical protein
MRELKIVFTKSKKKIPILSWLIMLWTKKPYSHVALKFESRIFKSPTYYQASDGLVNYMSGTQFDKKHEIVNQYEIEIEDDSYYKIREECHEEAGANYGLMQNVGIMITDVLSFFGIKTKNPFKKGRNCSELIYIKVLKPMFPTLKYNPDTIKPHQVENILIEKGYQESK